MNVDKKYFNITPLIVSMMYLLYVGKFVVTKYGFSAPPMINYIISIVTILLYLQYATKYNKTFIRLFLLYTAFFVFKSVFWGMPLVANLLTFRIFLFFSMLAVVLFELVKKNAINTNTVRRHFYYIFTLEILLSVTQFIYPSFFNYFNIESYTWNGVKVESGFTEIMKSGTYMVGTLMTPTTFSITMSMFTAIITLDAFKEEHNIARKKLLFIQLGLGSLLFTGVRTPFLMTLLAIGVIIYKYRRKWFKWFAILGFVLLFFLLSMNIANESSNLYRMQSGISTIFSSNPDDLIETTFGLTILMIPYFLQNPMFGVSLGLNYRLVNGIIIGGDLSTSDVQLIYALCEIGIVGLTIVISPLLRLHKICNDLNPFMLIRPILLLAFMLTIVDTGIFTEEVLFLYVACIPMFYNNPIK